MLKKLLTGLGRRLNRNWVLALRNDWCIIIHKSNAPLNEGEQRHGCLVTSCGAYTYMYVLLGCKMLGIQQWQYTLHY